MAVYQARTKTIVIQNGELYTNPFVILHEFYHHIRYVKGRHRGTEKHADRYALDFIKAFKKYVGKHQ